MHMRLSPLSFSNWTQPLLAGAGYNNIALMEDVFEALLGALLLDRGFKAVQRFLQANIISKLVSVDDILVTRNYKTLLYQAAGSQSMSVKYQAVGKGTTVKNPETGKLVSPPLFSCNVGCMPRCWCASIVMHCYGHANVARLADSWIRVAGVDVHVCGRGD